MKRNKGATTQMKSAGYMFMLLLKKVHFLAYICLNERAKYSHFPLPSFKTVTESQSDIIDHK